MRARVVRVRPRPDGSFAVTLGNNSKHVFWLLTDRALRHGDLVECKASSLKTSPIRGRDGTISIIEGGELAVINDEFARRLVAPAWYHRVAKAMRRPLFPHQVEGAAWLASRMAENHGAILADEQGLGKTGQAIAAVLAVGATPALVVCPSSLKINWLREFRYASRQPRVHVVQHEHGPLPRAEVLIANYDLLRGREEQLASYGCRCMVLDEGHAVKEPSAGPEHRASVTTRISSAIGLTVYMTGTPILNRPAELWRALHLVSPVDWPSYEEFKARYCQRGEDGLVDGLITRHGIVERVTELRCRIDELVLRRAKEDLLRNLPPKVRRTLVCELEPIDRKHYDAAEKDVVSWLKARGSFGMARAASHSEALVRLTMLRHIAARGKLRRSVGVFLQRWFREVKRPLVVFAYHRDVIAGVSAICARLGVRTACILGEYSSERRGAELDRFQCGAADVFLAPLRAAGVGLNLQRACDVLMLERLWSPSLMHQAEDRVHRLGQTKQVTIWYLDASKTVDAHVAEIVADKQRIIGRVVDDVSADQLQAEESSTLDRLSEILAGRAGTAPPDPAPRV